MVSGNPAIAQSHSRGMTHLNRCASSGLCASASLR